ncbi:MAG: 40S ribosomal protein S19 [Promethearchaeia archaeon]
MSIYSVRPNLLINEMAEILKEYPEIEPPEGSQFWKTAYFKELAPIDSENFWYVRCASLLRKVKKFGPIGVNRLRKQYGGKTKDKRGLKHKAKGSGKIIRVGLQQLGDADLVELLPSQGRVCTPEGVSLIERTAYSIKRSQ